MKRVAILAFGLAALAAAPASAAFLTNYESWSKLTAQEKLAYVRGVNDASSVVDMDNDGLPLNPMHVAIVKGRMTCLARDQVTDKMLVALIETRYQTDPSARDIPPMSIFERETYRICMQDIQAAVDAMRSDMSASTPQPRP
jgi:hypothetical protein